MVYTGKKLKEIIFPLGGIGSGSIGLAGNGSLVDWEIFNRPDKGSYNSYSFFAVRADFPDGKSITKVLQGDYTNQLMGQYSKSIFCGYGFGPRSGQMAAFPHFKKVRFDGKFPIAKLTFEDDDFPAKIIMTAFNPFIPLDADNSSIPAAFFNIRIKSKADNIKYTVILSVRNPFSASKNELIDNKKYTAIKLMSGDKNAEDIGYGDITIAVNKPKGIHQEYWYRGTWMDGISTFWYEISNDFLHPRHYDTTGKNDVCSIGVQSNVLKANDKCDFNFVLSWNIPNNYNYWKPLKDENEKDITWKNYYSTIFENSSHSAFYSLDNWASLYKKTAQFCNILHSSTLDKAVIDAISSTLSVLKSPTVLRLEDGTFYGWEGVNEKEGSCEGTCTHVWSYAYALCFLFPELERSLRNTEFTYDTEKSGKMNFRTQLPLGRENPPGHACVDGQMATIIKIYRDWKLTGNTTWLKENWENIKNTLEYAWSSENADEWDLDHDGVLEGRQHHTLDMELFGPSSWLQSMYLAALKAASEMASYLNDDIKAKEYLELFENGYKWTKENLFNGRYFFHKIDLESRSYIDHFKCENYWNDEKNQIKYQIGEGSAIDQMLGQWHANICGIGDVLDPEQRKLALLSMLKNNYKPSLRNFTNVWRIFALNDEGGSIICDYPEGSKKPIIPIPYIEECMTGFEYSFAGLLISEGFIEEGLNVVRAVRDRYDGEKRNPWNEIECGSNYARPMSSFALLPIFSGFEFDMPKNYIGFSPIIEGNFRSFWSVGSGWGCFIKNDKETLISLSQGSITLEKIKLSNANKIKKVFVDNIAVEFTKQDEMLLFSKFTAYKEIKFEV